MPTKRRKLSHRSIGISPAALVAWRAGAWMDLHRACGLQPWQVSPFDVDDDGYVVDEPLIAAPQEHLGIEHAIRLRRALIELAGEPGPRRS